jgi:hypothetical protein
VKKYLFSCVVLPRTPVAIAFLCLAVLLFVSSAPEIIRYVGGTGWTLSAVFIMFAEPA